jgi:transposase
MTRMPMPEEIQALQKALSDALGELRVVRTERDLLKEQLNRFKRQLFDAKSEVSAAHQKDLFFNEAEIEGAQAQPAAAETEGREDRGAGAPAHQARPQAAGSGPAARCAAPRIA